MVDIFAFNRTSMESKQTKGSHKEYWCKLLIEPVWNRNRCSLDEIASGLAFNRTSMESKHSLYHNPKTLNYWRAFNRTSMESKLGIDQTGKCQNRYPFNRTSMESKLHP